MPVGTWAGGNCAAAAAGAGGAAAVSSAGGAPASVPHPVPQPLVFEATEEDHCETPPEAYAHIAPLLRLVARALGREPAELRVYDPYFCNGAVARHLTALGFPLVHNRNEDFYALLEAGRLPAHDVVVTNPPYSGDHPRRLLRWLARPGGAPWLALMPNWVYAKPYYAAELGAAQLFVVPRKRYPYWTPRGRRADVASGGEKARRTGTRTRRSASARRPSSRSGTAAASRRRRGCTSSPSGRRPRHHALLVARRASRRRAGRRRPAQARRARRAPAQAAEGRRRRTGREG